MSVDRVLARLNELLQTMDDPSAAYVVRSRLDRVLLLVRQHVAQIRDDEPETATRVDGMAQRIEDAFSALRRRSEPFGEAWIVKLNTTKREVLGLRQELARAAESDAHG